MSATETRIAKEVIDRLVKKVKAIAKLDPVYIALWPSGEVTYATEGGLVIGANEWSGIRPHGLTLTTFDAQKDGYDDLGNPRWITLREKILFWANDNLE